MLSLSSDGKEVAYNEDNSPQVTGNFEMALGHLLSVRNDDLASLTGCRIISLEHGPKEPRGN